MRRLIEKNSPHFSTSCSSYPGDISLLFASSTILTSIYIFRNLNMIYTKKFNLYHIAIVSIFKCYNDVIMIYIKHKIIWLLSVIFYMFTFNNASSVLLKHIHSYTPFIRLFALCYGNYGCSCKKNLHWSWISHRFCRNTIPFVFSNASWCPCIGHNMNTSCVRFDVIMQTNHFHRWCLQIMVWHVFHSYTWLVVYYFTVSQ